MIIPIPPISTNKLWQGRRFRTKEYEKWMGYALWLAPNTKMIKGDVSVEITVWTKTAKRSDIDNFLKATLDLMVKKGWIEDDRKIWELRVIKVAVEDKREEKIEVKIRLYEE